MDEGSDDGVDRSDRWLAGAASADITPEEPTWMAGFGMRDRPSEGVHKDLHAKALALEDYQGNRVVIVSAEILFVGRSLRAAVAERCEEAYDLESRRLVLNASHTHQGPATRTATTLVEDGDDIEREPTDLHSVDFIPLETYDGAEAYRERLYEYRKRLEDTLVDLVGEAIAGMDEAELTYGHGRCGSAMSRRLPTEGGTGFEPYSDGPVDHDVPVLAIEDPDESGDEAIQAILFGYACHPSAQWLFEFSGDWIGYAQEMIEERYENATAVFLQGCGGDQKVFPERDPEYVEGHARALTFGVEAALGSTRQPIRGPLRVAYEETELAFEDPPAREELAAQVDDEHGWRAEYLLSVLDSDEVIPTEYPYPVQALGFSTDLTMLALGGEVFAEYSLQLKDELEGNVWVAGYSNAAFTYVPTRRALSEGGYEAEWVLNITTLPGPWKPDLEDRIFSTAHALANRVSTPPQK